MFLALLIVAALTGCALIGGQRTGTDDGAEAQTAPTATPEPIPTAGGELRIPMPRNPSSMNPLMVNTREMRAVFSLIFESLLQYDANNRLTPGLAENWSVDDSGRVWTMKLRKGVLWHGVSDELTANDVVYTYEQLAGEAVESSIYATNLGYIESMSAEDDYTLIVTGKERGHALLYALTFPVISGRFSNMDMPIGTGPFRVTAYDSFEGMELIRNEHWWKQTPYIEKVRAIPQTNNTTALAALELRQLDFVPTTILTASQYREQDVTQITDVTTTLCEFLIPNLNNALLKDVNIRKAIAYALDRRDIVSRAYLNHAFACDVPIPPHSWLYDAKYKVYDYNLSKAKALLEEAGWKDVDGDGILDKQIEDQVVSFKLRLLANESPDNQLHSDVASLIREQLLRVGIDVEVDSQTWTQTDTLFLTKLKSGSFGLALCAINLDMHPDLRFLIGTMGEHNYSGYSSYALDSMMTAARYETDEREIKDRYMELQQLIIEDLPVITLFFRTSSILYSDELQGVSSAQDPNVFKNIEKWFFTNLEAE